MSFLPLLHKRFSWTATLLNCVRTVTRSTQENRLAKMSRFSYAALLIGPHRNFKNFPFSLLSFIRSAKSPHSRAFLSLTPQSSLSHASSPLLTPHSSLLGGGPRWRRRAGAGGRQEAGSTKPERRQRRRRDGLFHAGRQWRRGSAGGVSRRIRSRHLPLDRSPPSFLPDPWG